MTILITQARFRTTATPENRVKAASQLVVKAGGTLIAYYLTSGDYDVLLIFQASSYEETVPALATAAAEIGVANLKTVTVLTSGEMKRAVVDTRSAAVDHPPAGAGVADLPSTEPTADLHTSDSQHEGTTGEVQADADAATRILDAHKKAVSDTAAGRPAPYYLVPPPTAAPSKTTPAPAAASKDAAKKKPAARKVSS